MSFDRLAPHYTWMESILAGRRLQRSRVTWLDELAGANDILIAGVGHGHFLRACARRFPNANITCVDASRVMLREAERRVRRSRLDATRLSFVHAALPAWTPPVERYDAIATHFFLDCFEGGELEAVIAALAASGRASCRWLVTDFAVPADGWSRRRALAVHGLMYAFFRRLTKIGARRLVEPDPMLQRHGFDLRHRRATEWGLLRADLWARGAA